MTRKPTTLLLIATFAFALLISACSSASDVVAENLAEELIEAGADGNVDVDVSGDGEEMTINLDTEDGNVSIDVSGDGDDATIEMESEDGTFTMGAGSEMPEGLTVPVPDGGEITTSVEMEDGVMVVLMFEKGRYEEIVAYYDDWTAGTGEKYEKQTMSVDTGGPDQRSTMWVGTESNSFVALGDCFDPQAEESSDEEFTAVCLNINQAP